MLLKFVTVGPFSSNCYIVADGKAGRAAVIDPGDEPERIVEAVRKLGVEAEIILLTHGHLDHITGVRGVHGATKAKILMHEADRPLYEDLKGQCQKTYSLFGFDAGDVENPPPLGGSFSEGDEIAAGGLRFGVLHTPGHTPGSCSFTLDADGQKVVFSGDTLFAGAVGRTDLWGGDYDQEMASIRGKLMKLPEETLVYPGHGPPTRIGVEKTGNPFVLGEA